MDNTFLWAAAYGLACVAVGAVAGVLYERAVWCALYGDAIDARDPIDPAPEAVEVGEL